MSERERLTELMITQFGELINDGDWTLTEMISNVADYLIKNGVIAPPVKVRDTVYHYGYSFKVEIIEILQGETIYKCGNDGTDDYMAFAEENIGKTVFLTKEEAEKALKGGAEQ